MAQAEAGGRWPFAGRRDAATRMWIYSVQVLKHVIYQNALPLELTLGFLAAFRWSGRVNVNCPARCF